MIRSTLPEDTPPLLELARGTGVFNSMDIQGLGEVLDDYHAFNRELGHRSVTYLDGDEVHGFAYFAPAEMTDGSWYLYWIAVRKELQAKGIGGALLGYAEEEVRQNRGRQMLIETSSLAHYEPTHRFYRKYGYQETAVVPDYYAEGDSMVIFRKRMGNPA